MIQTELWQNATLETVKALLEPNPDVQALVLTGSVAQVQAQSDLWSDLDLLLIVKDAAQVQFYPNKDWLKPLGQLYTWEQHSEEFFNVTRVCFVDLRRLDFVITSETAFAQIDSWPSIFFTKGTQILFAKTETIAEILARKFEQIASPPFPQEKFEAMTNQFWFKAVLAVNKVKRDDLLIALHLSLDLLRDCLVLGMMLRDRATGTTYHRSGGPYNAVVKELEAAQYPYTQQGILDSIEQTALAFDKLAAQWSLNYSAQSEPLLEWLNLTRQSIA